MITGLLFRDSIISAANNISNSRQAVDALNVFPVPDGDTGTNMSMTITAAAKEMATLADDCTIEEASSKCASALLRGARGNSGVILSLIFRGFSKGFRGLESAGAKDLANALKEGVDAAYKAVMKPTEGTILTVVRLASEAAQEMAKIQDDPLEVGFAALTAAKEALAKTPELLPVLKKAGVVDAGGQGLVLVFEGMESVWRNGVIVQPLDGSGVTPVSMPSKSTVANASDDIEFGYCSEFLIEKNDSAKEKDPLKLRAYLESIGDCVVVVDDSSIIKVHVHSNEPGNVIQAGLKYGQLINIKIDNMRYQHANADERLTDYERYVANCEELGVTGVKDALDRMIVCDDIIANYDRHWRNFGLVRNVNSLVCRPAPIFDSGSSLWCNISLEELRAGEHSFTSAQFHSSPAKQMLLVEDMGWFDGDKLEGFVDEAIEILSRNDALTARLPYLKKALTWRLERMIDIAEWS